MLAYAGLYGMTLYVDPLHYISTRRSLGRIGYIRGYIGPWIAEWYYLNDKTLLNRAVERRTMCGDASRL